VTPGGEDEDDDVVDGVLDGVVEAALDFPTVDRFLDAQRQLLDDEFEPPRFADPDLDDGLTPDADPRPSLDWGPD